MHGTQQLEYQIVARFWAKVDVRRVGECWEWTAARNEHGYGVFRLPLERRNMKAHRMAWWIAQGVRLDESVKLLHSCDNPPCVNPAHLRTGTQAENVHDMVSRGRQRGIRHSVLTAEDVTAILAARAFETQTQIAERFGISPSYISMIANGQRLRGKETTHA